MNTEIILTEYDTNTEKLRLYKLPELIMQNDMTVTLNESHFVLQQ